VRAAVAEQRRRIKTAQKGSAVLECAILKITAGPHEKVDIQTLEY
jgi:hypothetical protein